MGHACCVPQQSCGAGAAGCLALRQVPEGSERGSQGSPEAARRQGRRPCQAQEWGHEERQEGLGGCGGCLQCAVTRAAGGQGRGRHLPDGGRRARASCAAGQPRAVHGPAWAGLE